MPSPLLKPRDVIQSLWIGAELSKLEQLCMKSFLAHGHPFHLYAYNDIQGVPQGVILKDANQIIPEKTLASYISSRIAEKADWFRWQLLAVKGGWWVDMDTVCLKPYDFPEEIAFSQDGVWYANGMLKFPANHPLVVGMAFYAERFYRVAPWDGYNLYSRMKHYRRMLRLHLSLDAGHWGIIAGPTRFTKAVRYFDLADYAKEYDVLIGAESNTWENCRQLFESPSNGLPWSESSHSVHFWNQALSDGNIDKNADYPPDSPYEILKKRYGV